MGLSVTGRIGFQKYAGQIRVKASKEMDPVVYLFLKPLLCEELPVPDEKDALVLVDPAGQQRLNNRFST